MECGALDLLNKLAELSINYNTKQQEAIQSLVDKLEILVNNNIANNTNNVNKSNTEIKNITTLPKDVIKRNTIGGTKIGKDTVNGDLKDIAMRAVADGFIVELQPDKRYYDKNHNFAYGQELDEYYKDSPTKTSAIIIGDKHNDIDAYENKYNNIAFETEVTLMSEPDEITTYKTVLLTRGKEFKNINLTEDTKEKIKLFNDVDHPTFLVGDTLDVDTQFIEYLEEIGAKYTIYSTNKLGTNIDTWLNNNINTNKSTSTNTNNEILVSDKLPKEITDKLLKLDIDKQNEFYTRLEFSNNMTVNEGLELVKELSDNTDNIDTVVTNNQNNNEVTTVPDDKVVIFTKDIVDSLTSRGFTKDISPFNGVVSYVKNVSIGKSDGVTTTIQINEDYISVSFMKGDSINDAEIYKRNGKLETSTTTDIGTGSDFIRKLNDSTDTSIFLGTNGEFLTDGKDEKLVLNAMSIVLNTEFNSLTSLNDFKPELLLDNNTNNNTKEIEYNKNIKETSIVDLPEKFQTILSTIDANISNEFALRLQIGVYKTYDEAYNDLLELTNNKDNIVGADDNIPEFQKTNTPNTGKFDEKLNKRLQETLKKIYPNIRLKYKALGKNIRGQADIEALSVFINPELQTQDTLPHEYVHHYIAMFRESPIVQAGIKKYGGEEALVQAIGEQVVVQKGLAYNWWKRFSAWVKGLFKKLDNKPKEELRDILTNNFLEAKDLKTYDNMDTYIYNKILNKLETMYPDVKDSVDKYTKKELVLAVDSYVNNADISIKKYANIYVDMLEKSTFVNNLITKVSKDYTITREEAKHKISEGIKDELLDIGLGKSFDNSTLGKILRFIKYTFAKMFNKKQFEQYKIDFNIKQLALNIYNGENAEAISFKPKKGTKKVNPTNDFKQQPKAANIIYDVMKASNNTAVFTGSEALAMQGTIYRKQGKNGTDLHDLDFALLDSTPETISKIIYKLQQNSEITVLFDFSIPDNEGIMNALGKIGNLAKINILEPLGKYAAKNFLKSSNVLTLAVTPKGTKLANIKRFNEHSTSSRIVSYDIVDTNNKVVGTYEADIERNPSGFTTTIVAERTTGIQAIWVDLIEEKKKTLEDTFNWVAPNGSTVTVAKAATIFDAKNSMAPFIPRTKDVRDFNSFYEDSKKGVGILKPEYENKIIIANSGSGKTLLASSYDKIIDSDDILVNLLGIDNTDNIVKAFKKIKNKDKIYKKLADELVILRDKGYTILTPSTNKHILKVSDIAVLQSDKYTIQKRTSNGTRTNIINRSLQQAKNSIDFFKNNIRNNNNIKIIELLPSEFLSDELTYNKEDTTKNKIAKKMYNKYKSKIKECE